jgi:hypothetical protein
MALATHSARLRVFVTSSTQGRDHSWDGQLRLPRFVGDRFARQAIMQGGRIDCDSPTGRLICDNVVPHEQIDAALPISSRALPVRVW